MGVSQKGGPRDPKGYRGIIRGLYRAPLRDYIGVIVRDTHIHSRPLLTPYISPLSLPCVRSSHVYQSMGRILGVCLSGTWVLLEALPGTCKLGFKVLGLGPSIPQSRSRAYIMKGFRAHLGFYTYGLGLPHVMPRALLEALSLNCLCHAPTFMVTEIQKPAIQSILRLRSCLPLRVSHLHLLLLFIAPSFKCPKSNWFQIPA